MIGLVNPQLTLKRGSVVSAKEGVAGEDLETIGESRDLSLVLGVGAEKVVAVAMRVWSVSRLGRLERR